MALRVPGENVSSHFHAAGSEGRMLLLLCALLFCWGMLPQARGMTHGPLFLRINKTQLETGESQGMSLDKHGLQEGRAMDNSSGLLWCPFTSVHNCPCPSSALTLVTSSPRPAIQTLQCPPYHLPPHRGHGCLLGCLWAHPPFSPSKCSVL